MPTASPARITRSSSSSSSLASTSTKPPRTPRKMTSYTSSSLCAPLVSGRTPLKRSASASSCSSSLNGNTKGEGKAQGEDEDKDGNKENIEPDQSDAQGEDSEEEVLVMARQSAARKRSCSNASSRSGTTGSSESSKRARLARTESVCSESLFTSSPRSTTSSLPTKLPTPPPTPAKSTPLPSIYALGRSLLRCSAAATTSIASSATSSPSSSPLIGRSTEREAILTFVENADKASPRMIYVAGQPGTGKTALVSNVAAGLVEAGWKIGMINCVGAKNVWELCAAELGFGMPLKGGATRDHLLKCLKEQRKTKFLLILDELDSLISLNASTSTPSPTSLLLLESLFTLPSSSSNLHIISIANSLDLPTRHFSHLPIPLALLSFRAYAFTDLKAIIRGRLRSLLPEPEDDTVATPLIDDKAIELAARKGEAKDGDLRMCLDVCRMSIEAVEGEQRKKALASAGIASRSFSRTNSFDTVDSTPLTPGPSPSSAAVATHFASLTAENAPRAGLKHVLQAFKTVTSAASCSAAPIMTRSSSSISASSSTLSSVAKRAPSSVTISKIKSLNIQSRLILVALLVHSRRSSWNLPSLGTPRRALSTPSTPSTPSKMSASQLMCTTTSSLHSTYHHLLSSKDSPLTPVNPSDFLTLLSNLADSSLLTLNPLTPSKRRGGSEAEKRVDLTCMEEEVVKGLVVSDESSGGVVEEEARKILEREEERIGRAKESRRRERESEAICPLEDRL